ncbi:hypothetical protein [Flaviflexus huanghaiensis]|uniref:hypothetical protein n=1 Tax=Flaviflexus huanghaiensis TaxID=1111473 RepID=UPI0015F8C8B7|nr:hypothetical protein [Flaviflexus huanghaiensis]
MRRLVAALMLVAGMALVVVGIGSATWWKESPIVEASAAVTSESGVIATDPGVLELVDDTVRVTARAPGTEVEMVVASSDIAAIWLGNEPHVRVTGLTDWTTLSTEEPAGFDPPEGELSLQGSDLFHPENLVAAANSAELYFDVPPGDWTLIAVGKDGTTPQLTMAWEREVTTPWTIPLLILGVVVLAAGSALFLYDYQQRASVERRAASRERAARHKAADSTDTTVMSAVRSTRKTRGNDTVSEDVRHAVRKETGGSYGAGIFPARIPVEDETTDVVSAESAQDEAGSEDSVATTALGEQNLDDANDETTSETDPREEPTPEDDSGEEAEVPESTEPETSHAEDSLNAHPAADGSTSEPVGESSEHDEDGSAEAERASSAAWRSLWGFGPKE